MRKKLSPLVLTIRYWMAGLVGLAALVSTNAIAQADLSRIDPEELKAVKADSNLRSHVSRCAAAHALMARYSERMGEEKEMLGHRQSAMYWIAVMNEMFTEKWAEPRIDMALEYWKKTIEREGEENAFSFLLAQQLICERIQDRLEGVEPPSL